MAINLAKYHFKHIEVCIKISKGYLFTKTSLATRWNSVIIKAMHKIYDFYRIS